MATAAARPSGVYGASLSPGVPDMVSVVLPCLNEEAAVGLTVQEALAGLSRAGLVGEVIVVDNGSSDGSAREAVAAGARVVIEPQRGYGAAHRAGIAAARGEVIVMADADRTYDLLKLGDLVERLAAGSDMVIASRLDGAAERGAMPLLHRHLGTPLLTRMIALATGLKVRDSQSGYRAFWRDRAMELKLAMPGMEYASEMLLRAGRAGWRIEEVPSGYRRRIGESKLHPLGDGWRHLRFLLVMSPHLSLIFPGLLALLLGIVLCATSVVAPAGIALGPYRWLPIFLGPSLLVLGAQAVCLGSLAARRSDLTPASIRRRLQFLDRPGAVNRLLAAFAGIAALGLALNGALLVLWLADASGSAFIGVAGLAQAALIVGIGGITATLAADVAQEGLRF